MNRRLRPRVPGMSMKRHGWRQHSSHSNNNNNNSNNRMSFMLMDNPVNQAALWSQETNFLEELTRDYPLPQIVRCSSELVPGEEQGLPINIHVPMLLCSGRTAKKLLAKHVSFDMRSQRLMETDDSIVIPSDYEGNFLRLQARTTKDQSVMKTLTQIAASGAPAFLNLTPLMVFYQKMISPPVNDSASASSIGNETSKSMSSAATSRLSKMSKTSAASVVQKRVLVPPGSVFLISDVTKGYAKGKKKKREIILLRCTDPDGNYVLIAADQEGDFVEAIPPAKGETTLSVRSSELMKTNRYPSLVRFVYGDHIPRLKPCSYLFTLVDTFTEDSLIGCLLYPKHAVMIEIPTMCSLRFQVALNTEELMELQLPRQAQEVVEARRDTFMTDLKLKCKFLHRVARGESIDNLDDLPSATVRTRQYANEAFFYL